MALNHNETTTEEIRMRRQKYFTKDCDTMKECFDVDNSNTLRFTKGIFSSKIFFTMLTDV